ncbi:3-hydroxyanthranilate 3,4-dioxygenase [Marinihelvus fidelis]|uniref:3-hydroxyanthranilate 3,4-dioxygenase n=2 Tax=Marinihelvus fidelis TaxID=2613842 RepID=A0A5N0TAV0_9GAMM|nr:3-hydroxyanthranilate 3,4-dioxygenase [Marinihelvus fidelis]
MTIPGLPVNFQEWIVANRDQLKPPVGNKVIWKNGDFICMVVGGPNIRTDFHFEEGPEFFYQLEGDMVLRVHEDGAIRDVPIAEGEIFLLPPRIPHSPQRFENTVGLVIERKRLEGELDGLIWYCEQCETLLYEEYFQLTDIETQFPAVFEHFYNDLDHRTCNSCGHLNPAPAGYPQA